MECFSGLRASGIIESRHRSLTLCAAWICVFAIVMGQARSEETTSLQQELAWLGSERFTVTTASLREQTLANAPATIRVLTRRDIRERDMKPLRFSRVNNLLDKRYFNGNRNIEGLGNFSETPQDPRWITAGVRAEF